jgi:hypothetical protein
MFHAELRREFDWGNWELGFFEVLLGVPRRCTEEGDPFCFWEFEFDGTGL